MFIKFYFYHMYWIMELYFIFILWFYGISWTQKLLNFPHNQYKSNVTTIIEFSCLWKQDTLILSKYAFTCFLPDQLSGRLQILIQRVQELNIVVSETNVYFLYRGILTLKYQYLPWTPWSPAQTLSSEPDLVSSNHSALSFHFL